ncbi:DUF4349 domain-containing protein [Alkalibacterium sp. 20]|uniref:DUF4349 domain-containing protein n=1 Tax=Alkalibacterium sp. 20 TaxID=1798803 RepID=UPI0009002E59|nr:DUF4349 domain-containing protein [Alkalibacterium sp. 20]OJF94586.1 hypothetical protein AX762_01580 [Alkalibacterium sp. 20]
MIKRGIGFLVLFFLVLTGCSSGDDMSESTESDSGAGYIEEFVVEEDFGDGEVTVGQGQQLIGEKVIRRVQLEYETLDFQTTTSFVLDTVSSYDGYIEYSNESSYSQTGISPQDQSRQYRRVDYLFRIPTSSLDDFLDDLDGMDVYKLSENVGSEDVTQSYRDTESRIRVLENKEARLIELLEQADTIEAILQIENSLSDTIAERESLQSQLETFDDLIDYTEVHLSVTERPRIANTRGEGLSFLERIREALVDSFYAFYYFIQDAFIWFIYAVPFILIIGAIIGLVFYIRKKTVEKRK